jgi:hypothetical protein
MFSCVSLYTHPLNNIQLTASEEARTGKPRTTIASPRRCRHLHSIVSRQFGGDMVIDIMQTHPVIIIGGILQQILFFMPPEEFRREVRKRRTRRTASTSQAV